MTGRRAASVAGLPRTRTLITSGDNGSRRRRVKHIRLLVALVVRGPGRSRARRRRSRTTCPPSFSGGGRLHCAASDRAVDAGYRRRAPIGDPRSRIARKLARERLVDDDRSGTRDSGRPRGRHARRRSDDRRPRRIPAPPPASETDRRTPARRRARTRLLATRVLGSVPGAHVGEGDRDHAGFLRDAPLELARTSAPAASSNADVVSSSNGRSTSMRAARYSRLGNSARMFSLRIAWLAFSMAPGMPMAVSATCAIIAPVQTRPKRSVAPPVPRFARCDCTRAPRDFQRRQE